MPSRVLIIRFSSFGDIVQGLTLPELFIENFKGSEIDWVTRSDFASLVKLNPTLRRVWSLSKEKGLRGLFKLGFQLRDEKYDYVYDAHNNLRSHILCWLLRLSWKRPKFLRRPKNRIKRFLLFKLRLNFFPKPFIAIDSYSHPLKKWNLFGEIPASLSTTPKFSNLDLEKCRKLTRSFAQTGYVVLAPSAAWKMKRWPVPHWKTLIGLSRDLNFVLVGGPEDTFCSEISEVAPQRVLNLAGQLSYSESAALVFNARGVVSADTGTLHLADWMGIPLLALIGPTAFGFPKRSSSQVLEVPLDCRPCTKDGRGPCHNSVYQRCMVDILPSQVGAALKDLLDSTSPKDRP